MPDHASALLKGNAVRPLPDPSRSEAAVSLTRDGETIRQVGSRRVLGLSFFFHDSAAALVCDGRIVAAAAEERFCRRKHTNEFPKLAIEYCLEAGHLQSIDEVDAIVFYEKPILKLNRLLETLVEVWPRGLGIFARGLPQFLTSKINVYSVVQKTLPGYRGPILFAEHHMSHAASAFYCSPYEEAAILTIDGVGEWDTTAIGVGRGCEIQLDRAIRFPHSIGLLYSALTSYLGFQVNDGEWKVMGLAPYGEPKYVEQFRRLVDIKPDGSFTLSMDFFVHHYSSEWTAHNARWEALFGFPRRQPKAEIEQQHEDLARSGQVVVEEIILNLAREARRASGSDNLVIAGGVGLNSVANWKIEQEGIFKNVWIQPAAGDDGGALGAALLTSQLLFNTDRCGELTDACLGPEYSEREVLEALTSAGVVFERLSDAELIDRTAELIAGGKVIGWCRGRMEFGPRALGSRSILADATNPEMKAIINRKIKYREYFRPFAPAVPLEDVHRYFDVPPGTSLPFMLKVPRVRPEAVSLIPAVTHEDGSGRVQTVTADSNPLYYGLLKAVGARTGVPIIINTSFNVRGEPIVCTPHDALNCFFQTGIDALVVGNCLVTEKPATEVDAGEGYARSDALEAKIGKSQSSAIAGDDADRSATRSRLAGRAGANISIGRRLGTLEWQNQPAVRFFANAVDLAVDLRKSNRLKAYTPLHRFLKAQPDLSVIDVCCGSGWVASSCAHHYQASVTALEPDAGAYKKARSVARMMAPAADITFVESTVASYRPVRRFNLVHMMADAVRAAEADAAITRAIEWIEPGGYLSLGIYHRYARQPVHEHFDRLRGQGASDEALYAEFKRLNPDISDGADLEIWFADQILSEKSVYDYAAIDTLLRSAGCVIEATSLNAFGPLSASSAVERKREQTARHTLDRTRRYDPGLFIVWARCR